MLGTDHRFHSFPALFVLMMEVVLRVNQLDACELDDSLIEVLQHQFLEIFKPLQSIKCQQFMPEFKVLLRFAIWKYSVYDGSNTFGQGLMDLMYNRPLTSLHKGGLFVAVVLAEWLLDRCDLLTSKFCHPSSVQWLTNWATITTKTLSLLNFIMFLIRGHYPTLKERLLHLKMVPGRPQVLHDVSHSYLTRELLWHGFSEFVFFVLPHFNLFSLQNLSRRMLNVKAASDNTMCAFCEGIPTMPHLSNCGHLYCYYCLKANLIADTHFSCLTCNEIVTACRPASEAIL